MRSHHRRQSRRGRIRRPHGRLWEKPAEFRKAIKVKGRIDKNHKGFAFLIFDGGDVEDVFIPPRQAEKYFHGDRVEVSLGKKGEIHGIRVLEHRFREFVGRFSGHPSRRGGWVVYERKRAREEVYVPHSAEGAVTGDWVRAKLHFHEKGPHSATAEIIEVYGSELPARADLEMVAAEFNWVEEHSEAAKQEAKNLCLEVPGKDLRDRVDLRSLPFITIDGETARDFDDAIYVERRKSGYFLWIAISDVSHYVQEGSALDKEARSRGTSVYFPERAFHMLPAALSENLCSLKPREPRLALVARIAVDASGKRMRTEIMEAVIESRRRETYIEIQKEWDRRRGDSNWEYAPHCELYRLLRKVRSERGSIDFDLPEPDVRVDSSGQVISIQNRERQDSHRLIEEFMIAANEAVTEWILKRRWPFVYRIHEEPKPAALEKFQSLAATVGVVFSLERRTSPKIMADLVRSLEGHPAQALLNMALLRSMKQAIYSSTHGVHFGLASDAYTHFTSPIRRYPDLVVHRLLKAVLRAESKGGGRAMKGPVREKQERVLAEVCEHCSYRERLAADAEREAIKLKQVRLMRKYLGDEFEGRIVGMVDSGLFVQLFNPYVEGLVSKESMTDDFYEFNEERMIFRGKRKRKVFKVGDSVKIRVLRADLDRRQIDFGLIS